MDLCFSYILQLINEQDPQPRTVIALWKANLEGPKFHQSYPSVIIVDNSNSNFLMPEFPRGRRRRRRCRPQTLRQTRLKLAPANESDKQQLQRFCDACKGIPQVSPTFLHNSETPVQATAPPHSEDMDLAMAINASIQSAIGETPNFDPHPSDGASSSTNWNNSMNADTQNGLVTPVSPFPQKASVDQWAKHEASSSSNLSQQAHNQNNNMPVTQTSHVPDANPSAPPVTDEIIEDGPIQYPSIDLGPVDISSPPVEELPASKSETKEDKEGGSCVICLDAPVEGACIPCGHMAGCMTCLNEVKAKKWGCPVCRAKINQVVRLYAV
ncbi:hypothetical protein Patl1_25610 [Pistacia atlantica]|uniref:Uncharacterized protein n=1 Tax=Pistacia atlantica TaxID=434234 RepID=A0ACC1B3L3_9ROSI|nr:hypothetical protein Patl1_25610 [Pistacia atlantica]